MNQRLRPMLTLLGLICALLITGGAASAQTGGLPAHLTGPTWTLTAIQGPAQDLPGPRQPGRHPALWRGRPGRGGEHLQ